MRRIPLASGSRSLSIAVQVAPQDSEAAERALVTAGGVTGGCESVPHNTMHGAVGGPPDG